MTSLVTFVEATLGYASTPVLRGLNVDVAPGQALALIGPNGGGKTTLMRAITGESRVLEGKMQVSARRIGLVPQSADLDLSFPISAREVVAMGCLGERDTGGQKKKTRREKKKAREALISHSLQQVQLTDRAESRFGQLSGGQRQRILVARALATQPDLVMMDEPFNGLDAPSRDILTSLIAHMCAQGIAVIVSTHDLSLARDVCHSACLVAGRQVAAGPLEDVLTAAHMREAYGSRAEEAEAALT